MKIAKAVLFYDSEQARRQGVLTWEVWPLKSASLSLKAAERFPVWPLGSDSAPVGEAASPDWAHSPPGPFSNRYTCKHCIVR